MEIIQKDGKDTNKGGCMDDFDPEQFLGSTQVSCCSCLSWSVLNYPVWFYFRFLY